MNRGEFGAWIGRNVSGSCLLGTASGATAGAIGAIAWERGHTPWHLESCSQQGEDLIVESIFNYLEIQPSKYLDIGAADPVRWNNTYRFYRRGCRGVLVEPNRALAAKLRAVRPGDIVLEVGIGTTDRGSADYYLIGGPQGEMLNTFSREDAELAVANSKGRNWIESVAQMPLVHINRVLDEHFRAAAPDFLSIDIEGLDHDVLASLDWGRWRPKVVCAETLIVGTRRVDARTIELMQSRGYPARSSTWANTIFVDGRLLG
jgi:FkbM family methyltransferase